MSRYIDADEYVTVLLYDDEREEEYTERMTIAEALDHFTDEGCPNGSEPKRGEWIYKFRDSGNEEYKCSKCGYPEAYAPNFCPNCGADMRGADDE